MFVSFWCRWQLFRSTHKDTVRGYWWIRRHRTNSWWLIISNHPLCILSNKKRCERAADKYGYCKPNLVYLGRKFLEPTFENRWAEPVWTEPTPEYREQYAPLGEWSKALDNDIHTFEQGGQKKPYLPRDGQVEYPHVCASVWYRRDGNVMPFCLRYRWLGDKLNLPSYNMVKSTWNFGKNHVEIARKYIYIYIHMTFYERFTLKHDLNPRERCHLFSVLFPHDHHIRTMKMRHGLLSGAQNWARCGAIFFFEINEQWEDSRTHNTRKTRHHTQIPIKCATENRPDC